MSNKCKKAPAALMCLLALYVAVSGAMAAPQADPPVADVTVSPATISDGEPTPGPAASVLVSGDTAAVAPGTQSPASTRPASANARRRAAVAGKPPTREIAAPGKSARALAGGRISGRLELAASPNQPVDVGEVAQSVVYYLPKSDGRRPLPARFSVDTQSKGFNPTLLVVPLGSIVSFPNRDRILHNVFSKTPGAAFDLGYFGPGEARETRLSKPGLVVVNCSVHNNMRSNVLVLATPYYTRPGRDGRFSLAGLPPGPGTLVFWHPRANAQSLSVNGPVSEPVSRRLMATRASLDAHRH